MGPSLEREIEGLEQLLNSSRDPEGRGFVPLADAYRRRGDLALALEVLADGLDRHPTFASAFVVAARVHRDRGDHTAENAAWAHVLGLDPENAEALEAVARAAEAHAREAAAPEPPPTSEPPTAEEPPAFESPAPDELSTFESPAPAEPTTFEFAAPEEPATFELAPPEEPTAFELAPPEEPTAFELAPPEEPTAFESSTPEPSSAFEPPAERKLDWSEPVLEEVVLPQDDGLDEWTPPEAPEPAASQEAEYLEPAAVDHLEPAASEEVAAAWSDQPAPAEPAEQAADAPLPYGDPHAEEEGEGLPATRTLAELLVRQGFTERAARIYEQLIAREPGDPTLETRLAELRSGAAPSTEPPRARARPIPRPTREEETEDQAEQMSRGAPVADRSVSPFAWGGADASHEGESAPETPVGGTIGDYFARLLAWTPAADAMAAAAADAGPEMLATATEAVSSAADDLARRAVPIDSLAPDAVPIESLAPDPATAF